uniref:Uncharacterized protein n=1 Tax=Cucumis melo TaxID=3656 RepID=A0A9I9EDT2_CUCME
MVKDILLHNRSKRLRYPDFVDKGYAAWRFNGFGDNQMSHYVYHTGWLVYYAVDYFLPAQIRVMWTIESHLLNLFGNLNLIALDIICIKAIDESKFIAYYYILIKTFFISSPPSVAQAKPIVLQFLTNNGAKLWDKSVKMRSSYRKFINIREYDLHKSSYLFYPIFSVLSQNYKEKKKGSESQMIACYAIGGFGRRPIFINSYSLIKLYHLHPERCASVTFKALRSVHLD